MLYEYKDLPCYRNLPRRMRYLKYYLLGIADAEGSFNVSIKKQESARFGYVLDPLFQVTQHEKNKCVLELFRRAMNCGRVIEKPSAGDLFVFLVDNRRQLREKVIPFFMKYKPIIKQEEFSVFKEVVMGLERKEHLSYEGFLRLLELSYPLNYDGKQRRRELEDIKKDVEKVARSKGYIK